MLQTSKLTTKYQATAPGSVRKVLRLKASDMLAFEINSSQAILRCATPLDLAFTQTPEGTLLKWASKADDVAFKSLWCPI